MTAVWLQTHRKGLGPADETRTIGKCQAYMRKVKPEIFCEGEMEGYLWDRQITEAKYMKEIYAFD